MSQHKHAVVVIVALVSLINMAGLSHATLRVCNKTQDFIGVALGYRSQEGWVSEGWWRLIPGRCVNVVKKPLRARFYYLHVEDDKNNDLWKGTTKMCLKDEAFKIIGTRNCFLRGYQKGGFQEIDTGNYQDWIVDIIDERAPH